MICGNRDIGFKMISPCSGCKIYQEGEVHKLSSLIPAGHCFELLHSLLPYMMTFEHGGWFKWERLKNRVVVCCPSAGNNVCVELRKSEGEEGIKFEYRVIDVCGNCKFYEIGKNMEINRKDFNHLCWHLFNNIYPYLRAQHHNINITCGKNKGKGQFKLLKV